jgi:hypothetical protein
MQIMLGERAGDECVHNVCTLIGNSIQKRTRVVHTCIMADAVAPHAYIPLQISQKLENYLNLGYIRRSKLSKKAIKVCVDLKMPTASHFDYWVTGIALAKTGAFVNACMLLWGHSDSNHSALLRLWSRADACRRSEKPCEETQHMFAVLLLLRLLRCHGFHKHDAVMHLVRFIPFGAVPAMSPSPAPLLPRRIPHPAPPRFPRRILPRPTHAFV